MLGVPRKDKLTKVHFPIENGKTESLWASGIRPGHFRIDNNPFYAYGVSAGDVVQATADESGILRFVRVVARSGNRTIRILFDRKVKSRTRRQILDRLRVLGCDFEIAKETLVSVCIPPLVDLELIESYLDAQDDVSWEDADK